MIAFSLVLNLVSLTSFCRLLEYSIYGIYNTDRTVLWGREFIKEFRQINCN